MTEHVVEVLRDWMRERFDSLGAQVGVTQDLQRETNGRLRSAEGDIANLKPRLRAVEREMGETREGLAEIGKEVRDGLSDIKAEVSALRLAVASSTPGPRGKEQSGENRRITRWDVAVFCAGVSLVFGLGVLVRWVFDTVKAVR